MFAGHRAKQAAKQHEIALQQWGERAAWYREIIQTTQAFRGTASAEIVLGPGEAVFYKVTGVSLIEDRKLPGRYEGRSSGVSVPIGPVRVRSGQSRGHYVQGASVATPIDTGTLHVTNKRVVFQGAKQTRECLFTKLIGFQHATTKGETTFSVSNRQKPTTVRYGPKLSLAFQFRLELALAHYRGSVNQLLQRLIKEANAQAAARPPQPPAIT